MTAAANLSARNNEGQPVAVNVGNALQPTKGQVLTATDSTDATWQSVGAGAGALLAANNLSDVTSAATAFTNISPMTTLGDILYENSTPAPARLAGNTAATTKYLTQLGGSNISAAPAWNALPTSSTSATGVIQLDGVASDIQNTGVQAAGSNGKAADSGHVHFSSGMYLCAPTQYTTAGTLATTSATMSAVSSANVNTGAFVAPTSGSVLVNAYFVSQVSASADAVGFGLCAHGQTTPMIGYVPVWKDPATTQPFPHVATFLVTGLTVGTYTFDLMYAISGAGTLGVVVNNQTSTAPTLSNAGVGSPVIMTVQAV